MSTLGLEDWQNIWDGDCAVPAGRDLGELVDQLAGALGDPDPEIRDGYPYVVLRAWIERDVIGPDLRARLGAVMAARFDDPEIQARTFAPLVLDMIVGRGDFDPEWLAAFARWYPAEADLRGYEPPLGWLHAAAHGADLLGVFGLHPRVDATAMLDLAVARLLAPTGHLFDQQEDERIAQAMGLVLTRPELTEDQALAWTAPIEAELGRLRSPIPAYASNCLRTLRALYVLADRGVQRNRSTEPVRMMPHGPVIKKRIAEVLDIQKAH
ncbi:DUF2785 domain-containing protein [Microtetraspora malaysiensis]|uniref:DUF2785 domain-containing protein n=1 Tax=Microtetraspora malaysiensis TaxID=161358 RepID=UPI003D928D08